MTKNKCGVLIFLSALLVIFIFGVSNGSAGDDIYKWVDENGVTRFSNKPPDSNPSVQKYETPEMQILPARKQSIRNTETEKNYFARVKNSIQKWYNDKTGKIGKTGKIDKEDKKSSFVQKMIKIWNTYRPGNRKELELLKQKLSAKKELLEQMDNHITKTVKNVRPRCPGGSVRVNIEKDPRAELRNDIKGLKEKISNLEQ